MPNRFFLTLLKVYVWLLERTYGVNFQNLESEVNFMIRVKADSPDANFSISLGTVQDSEGNTVPSSGFAWGDPTSDNESAVSFASISNAGQSVTGAVKFGAPNSDGSPALANLNVELKDADGNVVLNKALVVEVSAGDPISFSGAFTIEGHADEDAAPAPGGDTGTDTGTDTGEESPVS